MLNIDGHKDLFLLAYADDFVVFCDSPADKTKILKFHRGRPKRMTNPFLYNGTTTEIINEINYLDIIFSSSGRFSLAANNSFKKSIMATHNVKCLLCGGKSEGWEEKKKLLKSTVIATALYASEIWGPGYYELIERTQLQFIKSILNFT